MIRFSQEIILMFGGSCYDSQHPYKVRTKEKIDEMISVIHIAAFFIILCVKTVCATIIV